MKLVNSGQYNVCFQSPTPPPSLALTPAWLLDFKLLFRTVLVYVCVVVVGWKGAGSRQGQGATEKGQSTKLNCPRSGGNCIWLKIMTGCRERMEGPLVGVLRAWHRNWGGGRERACDRGRAQCGSLSKSLKCGTHLLSWDQGRRSAPHGKKEYKHEIVSYEQFTFYMYFYRGDDPFQIFMSRIQSQASVKENDWK